MCNKAIICKHNANVYHVHKYNVHSSPQNSLFKVVFIKVYTHLNLRNLIRYTYN